MESDNVVPIGKVLREFQAEGVSKMLGFLLTKGHVYNASDPGCGKTIMTTVTLNHLKLKKILIICPAVMRLTWEDEFLRWSTGKYKVGVISNAKDVKECQNVDVLICSYEFTVKPENLKWLFDFKFDVIILDEVHYCLHQDSEIATPKGIKLLKQLNVGDEIYSFSNNGIDTGRIIRKTKGDEEEPRRKIYLENGKTIEGLDWHLIRTSKGWRKLGDLQVSDTVLTVRENIYIKTSPYKNTEVLQPILLEHSVFEQLQNKERAEKTSFKNMSLLQESLGCTVSITPCTNFLQSKMCKIKSLSQRWLETTNDRQKPHAEKSVPKESVGDTKTHRTQTLNPRREWETYTQSTVEIEKTGSNSVPRKASCFRACSKNKRYTKIRLSDLLQDRCSNSRYANWFRGRRSFSQFISKETTRFEEGHEITVSRVDNIEILKPTNIRNPDASYYDLELDRFHNYIANGIIVHNCKSSKAKRTKAILKGLWPKIKYKICLSGTPFTTGVMDGHSIFSKMHPDFGTKAEFGARYSTPELTPWGIKYKGIKRSAELKELMFKNFMVRYRKEEVLTDLPDTVWKKIILDKKYSNKEYEKEVKRLIELGQFDFDERPLPTHIASLRMLQGELKLPPIIEYVEEMLEQNIPTVVFAYHTKIVNLLVEKLAKFKPVCIQGSTKDNDRFAAVTDFQDGKTNLFIGQMDAAGVGITLTRASECVLAEIPYGPATLNQAVSRLERIGQKNSITVHNFVVANSIDQRILKILLEKQKIFNEVFC